MATWAVLEDERPDGSPDALQERLREVRSRGAGRDPETGEAVDDWSLSRHD